MEQLDAWLKAVEASHLEAFQTFVTGVQKDKDAVLAGLTLFFRSWGMSLIKRSFDKTQLSFFRSPVYDNG